MKDSLLSFETDAADRQAKADAASRGTAKYDIRIVCGREDVIAQGSLLRELAQRTGQNGALHWLEYHLDDPTARKKIPTLVLIELRFPADAAEGGTNGLVGAVLLFEYKVAGHGLRIFATDDTTGHRSVIAAPGLRTEVAEAACRGLLDAGALAVLATSESRACAIGNVKLRGRGGVPLRIGMRNRSVPRYLRLHETHDTTLTALGRHTRRNLRYYRRRLEAEIGVEFVPVARLTLREFLAMNRASTNPVDEAQARWRYDAIKRTSGTMLAGMRTVKGHWLSVIGGRRHGELTEIDWQMNLAGLPRYSLSTVMRAYVLEHEVALGMRRLAFTGGTPHSMRHSFVRADAVDVVALRRSTAGWLLGRLAHLVFPERNFLGDALRDEHLAWTTG